jgi:enolase-phosphatase E1
MIEIRARGVLLDIEGTTSSISFVYDVMFPFVRNNCVTFLAAAWETDEVQACLPLLGKDMGHPSIEKWLGAASSRQQQASVYRGVIELMDADVKATGLKQLQGLIWQDGFQSGELVAHLFADVAPAIKQWHEAGLDVRIYSSGSIKAQQLFFGHTISGNLLDRFNGHYDTTTGPKKDVDSYRKIANGFGLPAGEIVFISDVTEELTAAQNAGMQAVLSVREGNPPAARDHSFDEITSFASLRILAPTIRTT